VRPNSAQGLWVRFSRGWLVNCRQRGTRFARPAKHTMDDSDMDPEDGINYRDQLEFWGLKVLPGKPQVVSFEDQEEALVHITQARGAVFHPVAACVLRGDMSAACWLVSATAP
jgi:hypothetical protein